MVLRIFNRLVKMAEFSVARKSQFVHSKLKPHPIYASFKVTDNCNSRCITCGAWRKKSTNELTTNEVKGILKQFKKLGVIEVGFDGGEPLLRKDICELISYATKLGLRTGISTNGLLIDQDISVQLLKSGISGITISLDGLENTHDMIRGIDGAFEKTLEAIKILCNFKKLHKFNLKIAITIMEINLDDIIPVVNLADNLGITVHFNLLDFSPYYFKDAKDNNLWVKSHHKLEKVLKNLLILKKKKPYLLDIDYSFVEFTKRYFYDPIQKKIPCVVGYNRLHIGSHGEVYPCWVLPSSGNLREDSLEHILCSQRHKIMLKKMLNKKCPGCSCATSSNDAYHLPTLISRKIRSLVKI